MAGSSCATVTRHGTVGRIGAISYGNSAVARESYHPHLIVALWQILDPQMQMSGRGRERDAGSHEFREGTQRLQIFHRKRNTVKLSVADIGNQSGQGRERGHRNRKAFGIADLSDARKLVRGSHARDSNALGNKFQSVVAAVCIRAFGSKIKMHRKPV